MMLRITGFLLILGAVARAAMDWRLAQASDTPFAFSLIGDVWARTHFGSLQVLQPALERHVAEFLWDPVLITVLLAPMAPVLAGLGAALFALGLWLGRRAARRG